MGGFFQVPDTWRSAVVFLFYMSMKYFTVCHHNPKWRKVVPGPKPRSLFLLWKGGKTPLGCPKTWNKVLFGLYSSYTTLWHLHRPEYCINTCVYCLSWMLCTTGNWQNLISNQDVYQICGKQLHYNNAI